MRIVVKMLLATLSILAVSATAGDYRKAPIQSKATIEHDAEYVVYDLTVESNCYIHEEDSIFDVSKIISAFISWVENKKLTFNDGTIEYWADQNSTTRDAELYYYGSKEADKIANPCYQKYSTRQPISVRVDKSAEKF